MIKTLFQHGQSLALTIEPDWLAAMEVAPGDSFEVKIDGYSIVMTPVKKLKVQADFQKSLSNLSSCYAKVLARLD